MGNQAPGSRVGKIRVQHPDTGGEQWVTEKALEVVWSGKGWLRADPDPEKHQPLSPQQTEKQRVETVVAQTTDSEDK